MSDPTIFQSRLLYFFLIIATMLTGCVAEKTAPGGQNDPIAVVPAPSKTLPKIHLGTIAVAKVAIEHPSARLVYRANGVSDNIVRHLKDTHQYRVIDWTSLEDVLLRRNLEWSDLNEKNDIGKQIRSVLLNDYFLMGTITGYGERMDYSSSAFSKAKTQTVSTTIELTVKDSITNEIIASANGKGEISKKISQTLGFGAAGGNDTILANQALDQAVAQAITKINTVLTSIHPSGSTPNIDTTPSQDKSFVGSLPGNPKILVLLAEEEEQQTGKVTKKDASSIGLSVAENAMAKVFLNAKCQVLTAGDVVNKAYSIGGGEDLLLSDWVTEQDILELENLLQARSGLAAYAAQVGKTAGVDIVISGTVRYQTSDATLSNKIKATQSSAFLTVKAIRVRDKKTLSIADTQQDYMAIQTPNPLKSRTQALTIAAQRVAQKLLIDLSEQTQ